MSIPCIICHETFSSDTDVVAISRCGHMYHGNCLDQWKRSSPQKSTCPLCRKTYDKRSLRKLYFNVEEPELNIELRNDFKRQKVISENLMIDNNKLRNELIQNRVQIDKINTAWLNASNELIKIQRDYGIKCQAYSIIDTVNNEFLQDNKRLRDEISKLKTELDQMKNAMIPKNADCKVVDLTIDDDDIQTVKDSKESIVIEITDDEESESPQEKPINKIESNNPEKCQFSSNEECLASAKKLSNNDDYKSFEDFILSQI